VGVVCAIGVTWWAMFALAGRLAELIPQGAAEVAWSAGFFSALIAPSGAAALGYARGIGRQPPSETST